MNKNTWKAKGLYLSYFADFTQNFLESGISGALFAGSCVLFKRGSRADSGVIYRGPARFWVIIGLSLEGFPIGNYRGNASKSR